MREHPVDDLLVDVAAAEVRVAAGAEDLDGLLVHDPDDRDVERAAAEVEDDEGLRLAALEAVGDGGGGRLVDDQARVELGDLRRLARRVLLRLLEARRHGDHRVVDRLADRLLGADLELLQDVRRDRPRDRSRRPPARGHRLAAVQLLAHEALDLEDHARRVAAPASRGPPCRRSPGRPCAM